MISGRLRKLFALVRRATLPLLALMAVASVSQAQQTPIGNVAGVDPNAFTRFGDQQVTIIQGASLFEGQTIVTDANALVQIVFADDTRMVVGPNSELLIERYLLRDPNTVSEFVANAISGTFRFISGNSPSEAYAIRTPAGTIGVRGTEIDLTVDQILQQIYLMFYRGDEVYHCLDLPEGTPPNAETCTVLEHSCDALEITGGEGGWVATAMPGYMIELGTFDWTAFQFALLREFRVNGAWECLYPPEEEEEEPEPEPDPCVDYYIDPRTYPTNSCDPSLG